MRGFPQFSSHALTMRFAENTQHDTPEVLRLPRDMTMEVSKVQRRPWKLQRIFWKRRESIAPATHNNFRHVIKHVGMSQSATPAMRNEATRRLKHPKVTTVARLAIGTAIRPSRSPEQLRTVADGCERLRTVANVNATSNEHTLNPQTPRVKREPLLRIRENLRAVSDIFAGSYPVWGCSPNCRSELVSQKFRGTALVFATIWSALISYLLRLGADGMTCSWCILFRMHVRRGMNIL